MKTTKTAIETLQITNLNWKRIMTAIRQKHKTSSEHLPVIEEKLKCIVDVTGFWSISRKNLINVGATLISGNNDALKIISPICLNYTELARDISGINPLVLKHIEFLERLYTSCHIRKVIFLFPCHGSLTMPEHRELALRSCEETQKHMKEGYVAMPMHELFPSIEQEEIKTYHEISNTNLIADRVVKCIQSERKTLYRKQHIDEASWSVATQQGIAEFFCLGRLAAAQGFIICTHTTGRSRIYIRAGAGILHNPIGLQ